MSEVKPAWAVEDKRGWPVDYDRELCGGPVSSTEGCRTCGYKGAWAPHNKVEVDEGIPDSTTA